MLGRRVARSCQVYTNLMSAARFGANLHDYWGQRSWLARSRMYNLRSKPKFPVAAHVLNYVMYVLNLRDFPRSFCKDDNVCYVG